MYFSSKSAVAFILSSLTLVYAAPAGVYFCVEPSFKGSCAYVSADAGTCISFAAGDSWNKVISAVLPDAATVCTFYTGFNCTGTTFQVTKEYATLVGTGFNEQASSFACS
ncbi:uncharacterized protein EV420DRAFT_556476 [Desarmillaria tabescens]|uniref:Uncharacterized protein n=1 Tax=Armillaria tabescens TaxID=1929756 RepID=A0AA39K930_ARMTA|nr:uncharacterized protein EV420DRAFT_556476 [Desarmillaria tabescens]KAK0455685.1 hypothetical protein EV420DRAFT_556476 [Desarmillaria tabescens]